MNEKRYFEHIGTDQTIAILLNIDNDIDLTHMCQINNNFKEICSFDEFWKKRGIQKVKNFLKLKKEYYAIYSFKQTYIFLSTLIDLKLKYPNKKDYIYTFNMKDGQVIIKWYKTTDSNFLGQIAERRNWKNGKEDGLFEEWYKNGQIQERSNWENGMENGLYELWSEDGNLKERSIWKDGNRVGPSEHWYMDGKIYEKLN